MNTEDFLTQVSRQDFDLSHFLNLAVHDSAMRVQIIHQMKTHPHIMVYDHCFKILEEACEINPQIFYPYWEDFASLLDHPNSYHRDFGLILISLLAGTDSARRLDDLLPAYLTRASDTKFMTARCCVKSCIRLVQARPDLAGAILDNLFQQEAATLMPESQASLLKADLMEILEQVYPEQPPDEKTARWIAAATTCSSPKTRRKAKSMMENFHLAN